MNAYRPPSIRELGLKRHLDETAQKHDGLGYADFIKQVTKPKHRRLNKTALAKLFNVDIHTMVNWLSIYEEEQNLDESKTA